MKLTQICADMVQAQSVLQGLAIWQRAALKQPTLNTPDFRDGVRRGQYTQRAQCDLFSRCVAGIPAANDAVLHPTPETA